MSPATKRGPTPAADRSRLLRGSRSVRAGRTGRVKERQIARGRQAEVSRRSRRTRKAWLEPQGVGPHLLALLEHEEHAEVALVDGRELVNVDLL